MPKTVSATEAKIHLGTLLEWTSTRDEVIIESRGRPRAVLISVEQYDELRRLREEERRRDALARLDALAESLRDANRDLSEEEALRLADQGVRDAIGAMEARGEIRFRRP